MDMNLSKLQEIVEDRRAWRASVHDLETEQQQTQKMLSFKFQMRKYNSDLGK